MPSEDGVRCHDGSDVREAPASEGLSSHGQSPPLCVGQPESPAAELLLEDSILLPQVLDGGFLLTGEPAGHGGDENLPRLEERAHSESVRDRPAKRQLPIGQASGLNWQRFKSIEFMDATGLARDHYSQPKSIRA
jgi:hypothetical protein